MSASLSVLMCLAVLLACSTPRVTQSKSELDDLFARLRTTASAEEAHHLEIAIMHVWAKSGQPEVDSMMLAGVQLAHMGDLDAAIAVLDQVVKAAPTFAEGYDQRARVHIMRDEYGEAIGDLHRVLAIEPRHYSALASMGRILLLYDKEEAALHAFEAALAINPYLEAVKEQATRLRGKLSGEPV
jgi:tetratricopeptide (TPR) repeat protein